MTADLLDPVQIEPDGAADSRPHPEEARAKFWSALAMGVALGAAFMIALILFMHFGLR
jgi:hypothetical protein